jgi:DNA-binding XRE family transcriptional regulator
MDSKLMKSLMVLHGETNATLANFLGISEQSVCNKINENGTEFKLGEITKIKVRWNLDADMIDRIFFAATVSNLDTSMEAGCSA